MIYSSYILVVFLALILWAFWQKVRGQRFDDLLKASALEHHRVAEVHKKHPHGGTWGEFKLWYETESLPVGAAPSPR